MLTVPPYSYILSNLKDVIRTIPIVYFFSVPFSIPCLLLLRAFRVSATEIYVILGMTTGLMNYWLFHGCYDAYEGHKDGTMNFSQAYHEIWKISDISIVITGMELWGLTGFIFWLIAIRGWPTFSQPTSQDKQG